MTNWKFLPEQAPTDGQTVWTRLYNSYANPFKAVYASTPQTFTFITSGIVYPSWMVAAWKVVT